MKIIRKITEGNNTIQITDDNYSYTYGYYSNNSWVDDDRIILNKHNLGDDLHGKYVLIDLINETEEELQLGDNVFTGYTESIAHGEKFYYLQNKSELMCYNVNTKEINKICDVPAGCHFPHMTADGRYINYAYYTDDAVPMGECYVVDVVEKTVEKAFEKNFDKPFIEANHMMVCPTDKDKIFFAHEGDTFYISNRLWLYEKGKGLRCIAKQRLGENGYLIDCFGHECWAADGKGLYFVKYNCSPEPPKGICYVDLEGNQQNAIYGKYPYWHVCAAPNGRFLAADCQSGERSIVAVIDTKTDKEIKIAEVGFAPPHPSHPHPSFSPNTKTIAYHDLVDEKLTVCFVKVDDIIKK